MEDEIEMVCRATESKATRSHDLRPGPDLCPPLFSTFYHHFSTHHAQDFKMLGALRERCLSDSDHLTSF